MSSNCGQLNSNEDSEVMVRQVNLAAAFHDHISCTKMSQHSIGSGICGLQSANIANAPNANIGSMTSDMSTAFESDHMYATESKPYNDNSVSNGCAVRVNSLFTNSLSDERNQISKLTEMILGQLDLIQHQQEQLLKKDRQLQGLKQDREALCLRLEKMEKRIAVLSAKVANNAVQTVVTSNSISLNNNRTLVNNNSQTVSVGVETDCDQSGSDTIVEETNTGGTVFADSKVFSKLYSNTSAVNSSNSAESVDKITVTSKQKTVSVSSVTPMAKIKTEPQETIEIETTSTTTSSTSARKSRKRQPEVTPTPDSSSVSTPRKRTKPSITSDSIRNDEKKETLSAKETSCDSLSTLSTTQTNKSLSNKKKVVKPKSETSSRMDASSSSLNLNFKNICVTKDVLMTSKPYPIIVNNSQSPLELLCDTDIDGDNQSNSDEKSKTSNLDVIEVPSWRLHPVSSCYSLEGTENLDDEVFNRRHQKLENDEKRRKRWDIQRLREHRYNEKLRTGRYYNNNLSNNCFIDKPSDLKKSGLDFQSFYPEIQNLQYIEVSERLPFVAFGHPIPKLPTKFFSLPWMTIEKPIQTPTKDKKSPQKKN